ncbi:antitoxin [Betaproteobacteria bacterium]|nr:antitoxin [Betaproteobacteria bacterium]
MSMTRKPRYCLQCDDGTVLELKVKDVTVTVEGVDRVVPDVAGWHCPQCGEIEFVDSDGAERISRALRSAREEAGSSSGEAIRAMRKKIGFKQAEAGQLFGGGVNAFSLYERGKARPGKSTVILLELLTRHPELVAEVRSTSARL